jgi:DNA-binding response OmpR family regulator
MNEIKEPKKILLILNDPDPLLVRIYRSKFEKEAGWHSIITSTYDEALAAIDKEAPDVVLTDIFLSNSAKNGFDLIESIRKNENTKIANSIIIVLTNLGQEEDMKRAMDLGATKYLIKNEVLVKDVMRQIEEIIA